MLLTSVLLHICDVHHALLFEFREETARLDETQIKTACGESLVCAVGGPKPFRACIIAKQLQCARLVQQ